jgi:hypothetical protein
LNAVCLKNEIDDFKLKKVELQKQINKEKTQRRLEKEKTSREIKQLKKQVDKAKIAQKKSQVCCALLCNVKGR